MGATSVAGVEPRVTNRWVQLIAGIIAMKWLIPGVIPFRKQIEDPSPA